MGIFKRLIVNTSSKLMAKLGAHRGSHQLVLNSSVYHPIQAASCFPLGATTLTASGNGLKSRRSKRKSGKRSKRNKQGYTEARISEVELVASLSRMPPLRFHQVHGANAHLSKENFSARRTQSFCQAIVFSDRAIMANERVYVKVMEITKGWSGTIRFGFTSMDPENFRYEMPKHACPDMTSAGHTWARALPDEIVRQNTVIHFSYNPGGFINYGINNHECGVFYANVKMNSPLWFVVDIYGLTSAIELIDPRIHPPSCFSEFKNHLDDFEAPRDETDIDGARLIRLKQLHPIHRQAHSNEPATLNAAPERDDDHLAIRTFHHRTRHSRRQQYSSHQEQSRHPTILPNLDSIILQPSRQNIYTSMPAVNISGPDYARIDPAGYCRIPTDERVAPIVREIVLSPLSIDNSNDENSAPMGRGRDFARSNRRQHFLSETNQTSSDQTQQSGRDVICQQFSRLNLTASSDNNNAQSTHHKSSESKYASNNNSYAPVAAARRVRYQHTQNQNQTQSKRQSTIDASGSNSQIIPTTKSSTSKNCKGSSSSSSQAHKSNSTSSNDKSGNNSTTKDCPICFERPINCVLYQCGHMCTCYECGVKQWRTQSRTCPICRTIIKDVIKTYMS